jgi:hypothetical protein
MMKTASIPNVAARPPSAATPRHRPKATTARGEGQPRSPVSRWWSTTPYDMPYGVSRRISKSDVPSGLGSASTPVSCPASSWGRALAPLDRRRRGPQEGQCGHGYQQERRDKHECGGAVEPVLQRGPAVIVVGGQSSPGRRVLWVGRRASPAV